MPTTETDFSGTIAPAFAVVGPAFADALTASGAGGAALAVWVDGRPIIDVWGGSRDRSGAPWAETTTSVYFSMTKGLVAILVARLVEKGLLELDAPVARYWPEFGQAGKESIPLRDVMSHRAGLSYPVQDLTHDDLVAWDPVAEALAAQTPLWTPGTAHQYHALTYGWLVGEVIRRVTGQTVGQAFRQLITDPVGADAWIGLPDEHLRDVATQIAEPGFSFAFPEEMPFAEEFQRALTVGGALPAADIAGDGVGINDPSLQRAEIPAGFGIGTARALAAMWSSTIVDSDRTRAVRADVLDDMTVTRSQGAPVYDVPMLGHESWGTGFQVASAVSPMLGSTSFGHGGAGGQLSFADRDARLSFAFVTNDLQVGDDRRVAILLDALRSALGT